LLENVFVARLRALGLETHPAAFPARRDHRPLRGTVAIGADRLTKTFGAFRAVHDVSMQVRHGEVYGLLGANGAGKTTTIKMLCGLLDPTSGSVQLAGERSSLRSSEVRQRIGYMSQRFSLYEALTVDQNIQFFGGIYGLAPEQLAKRRDMVLDMAGLRGRERARAATLSAGWRQRLALGCAILHEPRIVFLDEPTSGLDPLGRVLVRELIDELRENYTICIVTHSMQQAARVSQRTAYFHLGKLIEVGDTDDIFTNPRHKLTEDYITGRFG